MQLFVFKFLFPPLLIALATFAARRWGTEVGGWLGALPVITGPISLLLAIEEGPAFAAQAAIGTILGLASMCGFCVAYAYAARNSTWPTCLVLGLVAFFGGTWLLTGLELPLVVAFLFVCAILALTLYLLGDPSPRGLQPSPSGWDIPFRMLVTVVIVVTLTAVAPVLGPQLTGLLNAFPVITSVMVVFSHRQAGPASAVQLLRGVTIGVFGSASFSFVVSAGLETLGLVATYTIACICAVLVNALALALLAKRVPEPA